MRAWDTPTTRDGLAQYDHLDVYQALTNAWTVPGRYPSWHRQSQERVRKLFPELGERLDRLENVEDPDFLLRSIAAIWLWGRSDPTYHPPKNYLADRRDNVMRCMPLLARAIDRVVNQFTEEELAKFDRRQANGSKGFYR